MMGAGKYDAETTAAREATQAAGIALIVIAGRQGHGFSVQAPPDVLTALPDLLRATADQLEADLRGQT
jgi:hypothetical protein